MDWKASFGAEYSVMPKDVNWDAVQVENQLPIVQPTGTVCL